ncbi:MAG: type IV conjugative transfer system coupling protein TraD [Gammaproteobacteria bacterium]
MSQYEIESLLRPAVEYYAAASYASAAAIAAIAPETLMLLPSVAYVAAGLLLVRGFQRFRQGYVVNRYKRGLWRLPFYQLSSDQIPVSDRVLFLGLGFRWDQRHAQRLADTERKEFSHYAQPPGYFKAARYLELKYEKTALLKPLIRLLGNSSKFNPVKPLPKVGGNPVIHATGLLEGEKPININLEERVGHMLVLGTTRVGKTRLLETLVTQDIRRGDVVVVFDPKGDKDVLRRMYVEAKAAGRLDAFYFFHLGYPEHSARYNAIGNYSRITEVASRIAGRLPGEGQSQAFREFVWRYVNVIAKALNALGKRPDFSMIKRYGENMEPLFVDYLEFCLETHFGNDKSWQTTRIEYEENYRQKEDGFKKGRNMADRSDKAMALYKLFVENDLQDPIALSMIKTFEQERGYLDKLVGSLLPLMEKLCTGNVGELLSPDYLDESDERPIFDWPQIFRTGGIVYIGLDALTDPEVASAVGSTMFADMTSVAGTIYKEGVNFGSPLKSDKKTAVSIHADEFNELIGDEFIPLLNKAGGAGYQVTAYTQTWSDVIARLGNNAKAGQVAGNFNSIIMLRVREIETAEMLTKQLKEVEIDHATVISRATDSSTPGDGKHFTSATEQRNTTQRVDLIHPSDMTQLPKGQAFALINGGVPYKIRMSLPDNNDFKDIPDQIKGLSDAMAKTYYTSEDWYQFTSSFKEVA